MKKAAVGLLIGLLMVALLVVPALTKGGSAKGVTITYTVGLSPVIHIGVFYTTGSGIIHEWMSAPLEKHYVFKPLLKFPNLPEEPGSWVLITWPFAVYTLGQAELASVFGPVGTEYWFSMTED